MTSRASARAALLGLAVLGALYQSACASGGASSRVAETTTPSAPDATVASAATEDAESFRNTVRWTTASELENFGFEVYRAESEDGPFDKLNPEIIEGAGTVDTPQRYAFVDDTIDPCVAYFYFVESVSLAGVRERLTPVGRAAAKLESDDPRCAGT